MHLKQVNIDNSPTNVIPIVTTIIPSILVASLASTTPMATLVQTTTSTIGSTGDETNRTVKAMEEISIQTTEMNKLKEKVTSLETDYKLSQIMHRE